MSTLVEAPRKLAPPPAVAPSPPAVQPRLSEDWLAVCIGLGVFVLSLGLLFGADVLGWVVTTAVWTAPAKALVPVSKAYKALPGLASLFCTYIFLLAILLIGAKALRANLKSFAKGFTGVFFISYVCWFIGSWAYIAATPDKRAALKIPWSLNLTNESGFIWK